MLVFKTSGRLRKEASWVTDRLTDDDDGYEGLDQLAKAGLVQEGLDLTKVLLEEVTDDQLVASGHYRPRELPGDDTYCPLDLRRQVALQQQSAELPQPSVRREEWTLSEADEEFLILGHFLIWHLHQRAAPPPPPACVISMQRTYPNTRGSTRGRFRREGIRR